MTNYQIALRQNNNEYLNYNAWQSKQTNIQIPSVGLNLK